MNFQQAFSTVVADLTPQPWDYTAPDGVTLTVIPRGWREGPGEAEVLIRVTESHTRACRIAVTTAEMPKLLAALDTQTAVEFTPLSDNVITLDFGVAGDVTLTVTEIHYTPSGATETPATIQMPAEQRLPLASALRRALDVARGWETA